MYIYHDVDVREMHLVVQKLMVEKWAQNVWKSDTFAKASLETRASSNVE